MTGAEGLVEEGKCEAGFTRKQMLELGLKGLVGVRRGGRGRVCHTAGTAEAKANGQASPSVECWPAARADCVHLFPAPRSGASRRELEISHSGSIHTTGVGKSYG